MILIIIGSIVGVIAALLAFLLIKSKISENKPYYPDNYYEAFKSECPLEQKFAGRGAYEVKKLEIDSEDKRIEKITLWYPAELENSEKAWPLIMHVNPSNTRAKNIGVFLERLASWGFIVVDNEDPQTGTGETASLTLDSVLNQPKESVLYRKIDQDNMGIIGYSQGGPGAINAVTRYENGSMYKTLFTGSAAYARLSKNMGWEYDLSKLSIPCFMAAGTGKTDDSGKYGEKDFAGVSPLFSQEENYAAVTDEVMKVRGRIAGAEHEMIGILSESYMTAWMLYQLTGDQEASQVFLGEDAEILKNPAWQDVERNEVQ